jgi:hypothetical protein
MGWIYENSIDIKVLPQKFENCNVGVTDGRHL